MIFSWFKSKECPSCCGTGNQNVWSDNREWWEFCPRCASTGKLKFTKREAEKAMLKSLKYFLIDLADYLPDPAPNTSTFQTEALEYVKRINTLAGVKGEQ